MGKRDKEEGEKERAGKEGKRKKEEDECWLLIGEKNNGCMLKNMLLEGGGERMVAFF